MTDEFSRKSGLIALHALATTRASYPQGQKVVQIPIVLDDEHWNTVAFCLEAMLIAQKTEDNQIVPDFMTEQMQRSLDVISDVCRDVISPLAAEELAEELNPTPKEEP